MFVDVSNCCNQMKLQESWPSGCAVDQPQFHLDFTATTPSRWSHVSSFLQSRLQIATAVGGLLMPTVSCGRQCTCRCAFLLFLGVPRKSAWTFQVIRPTFETFKV